jgi:hypothetical protein
MNDDDAVCSELADNLCETHGLCFSFARGIAVECLSGVVEFLLGVSVGSACSHTYVHQHVDLCQ